MAFPTALGLEHKIQMVDQRALGLASLKVRPTKWDSRNLLVTRWGSKTVELRYLDSARVVDWGGKRIKSNLMSISISYC